MENDLIELLIKAQNDSGLENIEFASYYGLSKYQWCRIKNRKRKPGIELLSMVLLNNWDSPKMRLAVLKYLYNMQEVRDNHNASA